MDCFHLLQTVHPSGIPIVDIIWLQRCQLFVDKNHQCNMNSEGVICKRERHEVDLQEGLDENNYYQVMLSLINECH